MERDFKFLNKTAIKDGKTENPYFFLFLPRSLKIL
uniref:Uncharacterized protein n=1 Tax=viral metagenome TaxID=1070528 RepID=A0A6C0CTQ3_9ZZZZ